MPNQMYSFDYQVYDSSARKFIKVTRSRHPIHHDELEDLSVKMIQANAIPPIVPLEIEEINLDVTLHYEITGRVPLEQYLSMRSLSLPDFYQLLEQIIGKFDESRDYLLNEQKFVIHEAFIFVKDNLEDVRLMYLPLQEIAGKVPIQLEFRQFMLNMVGRIRQLSGNGFQELLNYLGSSQFSLEQFRSMVAMNLNAARSGVGFADLQQTGSEAAARTGVGAGAIMGAGLGKGPGAGAGRRMDGSPAQAAEKNEKSWFRKSNREKAAKGKPEGEKADTEKPWHDGVEGQPKSEVAGLNPKVKLYTILAAILAAAGIWKLYLSSPSEGMLFLCIGLTILAADLVYIVLAIIKPGGQVPVPVKEKGKKEKPALKKTAKNKRPKEAAAEAESDPAAALAAVIQPAPVFYNPDDYYLHLGNETTLLMKPEDNGDEEVAATVLLSEVEQRIYPVVEIEQNGKVDKVKIDKELFIVGRNPEQCHYVLDAVGISRTHFEIAAIADGQYGIRDLHSKNGTMLNGQKLTPGQIYPIKDRDSIFVGRLTCAFKQEA
ncbi:FHA domain-containing protein [Neobacillus niacini]|uniref:FHA domain-containing protein n=1 Tax=Neobacillus niacini TaxID=86668 RepID=UPI0021CAEBA5|nr:FHA domain-containing protein [Neobacillus niacini]MCM3768614.1 FHA domain-containing protein [Neobacillus niacini]